MREIRAVIVEDEPNGLKTLIQLLAENCPYIKVVGTFMKAQDAIKGIKRLLPDVIFLDIMLDTMSGFDVLDKLKYDGFEVIFITAYDEFAINAFKKRALDYLLKPVKTTDLINTARLLEDRLSKKILRTFSTRLKIDGGEKNVDTREILYLEADDTKCWAYLFEANQHHPIPKDKNKRFLVKELLKDTHAKLHRFGFCRPNKSFLVNLNLVDEYRREDTEWIIMKDGYAINITQSYRDSFKSCRQNWELPR